MPIFVTFTSVIVPALGKLSVETTKDAPTLEIVFGISVLLIVTQVMFPVVKLPVAKGELAQLFFAITRQ